jgi:hypothetical protein
MTQNNAVSSMQRDKEISTAMRDGCQVTSQQQTSIAVALLTTQIRDAEFFSAQLSSTSSIMHAAEV